MQQAHEKPASPAAPKFGARSPVSFFNRVGDRPAPVWSVARFPLFEGIDEATRQRLDEAASWARFAAGQMIFSRDDDRQDVFFVAEGKVRVVNYSSFGREVVYAALGPGEFFGELSVLGHQPRTAEVWAVETTLIAALPPEELLAVLRDNSVVALRMLERLAHVIREADDRIGTLS